MDLGIDDRHRESSSVPRKFGRHGGIVSRGPRLRARPIAAAGSEAFGKSVKIGDPEPKAQLKTFAKQDEASPRKPRRRNRIAVHGSRKFFEASHVADRSRARGRE